MNLAERVAMKNKLIAESGLDAKEWQARATIAARSENLEFNDWLALGKNVPLDVTLGTTSIFTDGASTAQEETTATSVVEGDEVVTEDNKLSTQEHIEETATESAEEDKKLLPEVQEEPVSAEANASIAEEAIEEESTESESKEIVDQASSLRVAAAEAAVASEPAERKQPEQESASSEAVKEQEVADVPTPKDEQQTATLTSEAKAAEEIEKAAEEIMAVDTTDRTLEVIGKEKGGPAITEATNPVVGSGDVATQALFSKVAAATSQVGEETEASGDTYAEFIENHVSKLCQQARVSNIDLTSFGIRARSLNFKNLKILSYGKHKFLGLPLNAKQEEALVFRLGLYCQQSPKEKLVIEAVSEVKDSTGFTFYSLLYTDSVVQKFVNATNFTVYINANDPDVSKLVMVVEKCSTKNSILS
jgi:hypothetical protein